MKSHIETEAEFRGFVKAKLQAIDQKTKHLDECLDALRTQLSRYAYKVGGVAAGLGIITTIILNKMGGN